MQLTRIETNRKSFENLLPSYVFQERPGEKQYVLVGAIEEGVACGALCCELEEYRLHLVHLFVAPDYRRRGIASEMFSYLQELAEERDLNLTVSALLAEEDRSLFDFYAAQDGLTMGEAMTKSYRVPIARLTDHPHFSVFKGEDPSTTFEDLTAVEQRSFLHEHGLLEYAIITLRELVPACSRVVLHQNRVRSCILVEEQEEDLAVRYLYVERGYQRGLMLMLRSLCEYVKDRPGYLYFDIASVEGKKLLLHLFPEAEPVGQLYLGYFGEAAEEVAAET